MVKNGGLEKSISLCTFENGHIAFLYVHFEGLTTDSYFGKTRPPGERSDRKKAFITLFWWENMISDMSSGF